MWIFKCIHKEKLQWGWCWSWFRIAKRHKSFFAFSFDKSSFAFFFDKSFFAFFFGVFTYVRCGRFLSNRNRSLDLKTSLFGRRWWVATGWRFWVTFLSNSYIRRRNFWLSFISWQDRLLKLQIVCIIESVSGKWKMANQILPFFTWIDGNSMPFCQNYGNIMPLS